MSAPAVVKYVPKKGVSTVVLVLIGIAALVGALFLFGVFGKKDKDSDGDSSSTAGNGGTAANGFAVGGLYPGLNPALRQPGETPHEFVMRRINEGFKF